MAKLSYRVSYYVLYVLFAAILVVLGLFYFGGDAQGDAVLRVLIPRCGSLHRQKVCCT